jgi:hypothetical protein
LNKAISFGALHESGSVQVFSRRKNSLTTRYGERRLKSAKARSRGKLGTGWQRALWGFELSAEVGGGRNSGVIRAARVHGRGIERLPGAFRYAFWADGGANGALLEVIG